MNEKFLGSLKDMKDLEGLFFVGRLDGVDIVPSGTMSDGKAYGASVKLKFTMKQDIIKNVKGVEIPTSRLVATVIRIPTIDNDLPILANKFNSLLGKRVFVRLNSSDNMSFNANDNDILEIK